MVIKFKIKLVMSAISNPREELLAKLFGCSDYFGMSYETATNHELCDEIVNTIDGLKEEASSLPSDVGPDDAAYLAIRNRFEVFLQGQG